MTPESPHPAIPPPPPERERVVEFRGRTRRPEARKTRALVKARKVEPDAVLDKPRWRVRWSDHDGREHVADHFGRNRQQAQQLACSIATHDGVMAVVEHVPHPEGEPT